MSRPLCPIAALLILCVGCHSAGAGLKPASPILQKVLEQPDWWFGTAEGQRLADHIVSWQNGNGGWWKKYDPLIARPTAALLPPPDTQDAPPGDTEEIWRRTSTFDNDATIT